MRPVTVLPKGANTALTSTSIRAVLGWNAEPGVPDVDASALLVTAAGKVRSDADFVFYNAPAHPSGAVAHRGKQAGQAGQATDSLSIDLGRLERDVERVVLAASADGGTFGQVPGLHLRLMDAETGTELARFDDMQASTETAFVAGELYLRGGAWKFRAVGQGWASGLAGLATDFGITVNDHPAPAPAAAPVGASPAVGPAAPVQVPTPTVHSLTRQPLGAISLQKAQKVSFAKTGQKITAHLKWTKARKDLDLYALYVDRHGNEGVCYYRNQGSLTASPYVCLTSGDSREPGMETIEIARPDDLRWVLICAYSAVENGFGSFKSFGAFAEVTDHAGSVVQTPLYYKNSFSYWVAIARIDLTAADAVSIEHVETYAKGGSERRPLLRPDGTFEMSKGPVEFKSKRLNKAAERLNRQQP